MVKGEKQTYQFGEFVLNVAKGELVRAGQHVQIPPKVLETLVLLVERQGSVVTKNEMLAALWPDTFVEEANLTQNIFTLRRILGETNGTRFIETVPRRGYRFTAEVRGVAAQTTEVVLQHDTRTSVVVERGRTGVATGLLMGIGVSVLVTAVIAIGALVLWPRLNLTGRTAAPALSPPPFASHRVRQLTTNGKVGLAALSPDGRLFAYTIDDLGEKSLWLGHVNGGNHLELRKAAAETTYATLVFAPDSSELLFAIRDEKNSAFAVYKMPVSGGVATKLHEGVSHFALSPDGSEIAFVAQLGESMAVKIAPLYGDKHRIVATLPNDNYTPGSISWSPDGTRLAASIPKEGRMYDYQIAIIRIATGEVSRFSAGNFREIGKTAWLADATGLIVVALEADSLASVPQYRIFHVDNASGAKREITTDRSNYGRSWHNDAGTTLSLLPSNDTMLAVEHRHLSNIWVAPADSLSAARQITFGSFGRYDGLWGLDWAPDGRLIYTTSDTNSQYISEMNADGSEQTALTAPGAADSAVTVSSDGRYVFFHSTRTGGSDIWRMGIDGGNPIRLTSDGRSFQPAVSPDGRWVYYRSWLTNFGRLCRVAVEGGESHCLNNTASSWPSFSPDGKLLAVGHNAARQIVILSTEKHHVVTQFDLPPTGTIFGGTRWTPDSNAVVFRDSSYGYWSQPIAGGKPQRMDGLPKERLYNFAWSRDGKAFAYVRGQEMRDVVLLSSTPE